MNKIKGFTLIELLVVIGIIMVLIAFILVALDPSTRFAQARDAVRQNDAQDILASIKLHQIENGGSYASSIQQMNEEEVYMLVTDQKNEGCHTNNANCVTLVSSDTHCLFLDEIVSQGYIETIPVSPSGETTWDQGKTAADFGTGYTLQKTKEGAVVVRACETEYPPNGEIQAAR